MGEPLATFATDGTGGPHLLGAQPPQQLGDIRIDLAEVRFGLRVGGAGADDNLVAGVLDGVEAGDLADVDHLWDVAELFGHPQADVGAAGNDGRVGMLQVERGEAVEGGRRGEECLVVADVHILAIGKELEHPGHVAGAGAEAILARLGTGGERGIDDRPIAGAAAEIAGDHVVDLVARHRTIGRLVEREDRHDETRRAEAALRSVVLDHRQLHRMERAA